MNEEYLQKLHGHLGIEKDYNTWVNAVKDNDEYLQGLHGHLGIEKDFATWKSSVWGSQVPEVPKGEEAEVVGESDSTSASTASLSDSNEPKEKQLHPFAQTQFPELYAEYRRLEKDIAGKPVMYQGAEIDRMQELEAIFNSQPEKKSMRRMANEEIAELDKQQDALVSKYVNLDLGERSIEEVLQSDGTYQDIVKQKQRLMQAKAGDEAILEQIVKDTNADNDNILIKLGRGFGFGAGVDAEAEQTLELDEKLKEQILVDVQDDEKLRQKIGKGYADLAQKESIITNAKAKVLGAEYNKLKGEAQKIATDPELTMDEKQSQLNELQGSYNELLFAYGYDQATEMLKNNFDKTNVSQEFDEMYGEGGFFADTADAVSTFLEGIVQTGFKGTVGFTSDVMSGLGNITSGAEDDEYSVFDAFSDTIYQLGGTNLLPSSKSVETSLMDSEGDFNIYDSDGYVDAGQTYKVGMKTLANLLPTTLAIVNDAKRGKIKRLDKVFGQMLNPQKNKKLVQSLSLIDASYRHTLSDNLVQAEELGLDRMDASIYANTLSMAEGMAELIMPDTRFFKTTVGNTILKQFSGDLASAASRQARQQAVKNFIGNMVMELGEEEVVLATEDILKFSLVAGHENSEFFDVKRQKELVASTFLLSGALGGANVKRDYQGNLKEVYTKVSENINEATEGLQQEYDNGLHDDATREEIKKSIDWANKMHKSVMEAPASVTANQIDLMVEKQDLVKEMQQVDDAFKPQYKEIIEALNAKILANEKATTDGSGQVASEEAQAETDTTAEGKKASYIEELNETKESDPEQYWSVDSVSPDAKGQVVEVEGGKAFVKEDGDIVGVFKEAGSKAKRVADNILQKAVEMGGKKLDNFDNYLTKIYKRNGFRTVGRMAFSEEYAPEGWNKEKHGTPDVVAMVYDPNNEMNIEEQTFEDYDEMIAYRDSFLEEGELDAEFDQILEATEVTREVLDEQVSRAGQAISQIAPDVSINIYDSDESFMEATGSNAAGEWNPNTNTISINASQANDRTVAHEVMHAVLGSKIKDDAKLQEVTDKFMQIINPNVDKATKAELDKFTRAYGEDVRSEEAISELAGILASRYQNLSKSAKSYVRQWLDQVAKMLGFKKFTDNDVIDFLNTVAAKTQRGEAITEEDINVLGLVGKFEPVKGARQEKYSVLKDVVLKRFDEHPNTKVKRNVPMSDLSGKNVSVIESDRMTGAYIPDSEGKPMFKFLGGIYYPIITGKWWASSNVSKAQQVARANERGRDADGYIYTAPVIAKAGSHMSNRDMLETAWQFIKHDAFQRGNKVTKAKLIELIDNAFALKRFDKGRGSKLREQLKLNKSDNVKTIINKVDKLLHTPQAMTFDQRLDFVKSLLGDPKVREERNFPTAGSFNEFASKFEEEDTKGADAQSGNIVMVMRTKGNLSAQETPKSDEWYHKSYPAEITSDAPIEVMFLKQPTKVWNAIPEMTKKDGSTFSWEEYKNKYPQGEKFAQSQYVRTSSKLAMASGEMTTNRLQMSPLQRAVAHARTKAYSDRAIRNSLIKRGFDQQAVDAELASNPPQGVLDVGTNAIYESDSRTLVGANRAALEAIQDTRWYKNLTKEQKSLFASKNVSEQLAAREMELRKGKGAKGKANIEFRKKVREATGQVKDDKKVTMRETTLNKKMLKLEEQASKRGERVGRADVMAAKKEAIKAINDAVRPLVKKHKDNTLYAKAYSRALSAVNQYNGNNIGVVNEAIAKVEAIIEKEALAKSLRKNRKKAKATVKRLGRTADPIRRILRYKPEWLSEDDIKELDAVLGMFATKWTDNYDADQIYDLEEKLEASYLEYIGEKLEIKQEDTDKFNELDDIAGKLIDLEAKTKGLEMTQPERDAIRDFARIEPEYFDGLKKSELREINRALTSLVENGILVNQILYRHSIKHDVQVGAADMKGKMGDQAIKTPNTLIGMVKGVIGEKKSETVDDVVKKVSNRMLQHIDTVITNFKGNYIYTNIINPFSSRLEQANNDTNATSVQLDKLIAKAKRAAKGSRLKRLGGEVKRGALIGKMNNASYEFQLNTKLQFYFRQKEFESNPVFKNNKVFSIKDHMDALNDPEQSNNLTDASMQEVNRIYGEYMSADGNIDLQQLEDSFTPQEMAIIEFMEEKILELEEKSRFTGDHVRGESQTFLTNYFPRKTSTVGDKADTTVIDLVTDAAGAKIKADSANTRVAKVGEPLDFATMNTFMQHVGAVNIDYRLSPELTKMRMFQREMAKGTKDQADLGQVLLKVTNDMVKAQVNNVNDPLSSNDQKFFNILKRKTFNKVLIDPVKLFGWDLPSTWIPIIAANTYRGGRIVKANKAMSKGLTKKIMQEQGSVQVERIGSRSADIKATSAATTSKMKFKKADPSRRDNLADFVNKNKVADFADWGSTNYYKTVDAFVGVLWRTEMFEAFKGLTGQELTDANYDTLKEQFPKEMKKAVAMADKSSSNLFNTAAPSEQKLNVQLSSSSSWKKIVDSFMKSFAFNENSVMWDSLSSMFQTDGVKLGDRTIVPPIKGNQTREEAMRTFAIVNMRAIGYAYMSQVIMAALMGKMDDDDEVQKISDKAMERAVWQHGMLYAFGNKGNVFNMFAAMFIERARKSVFTAQGEKYNPYEDSNLYAIPERGKFSQYASALGAEGEVIKVGSEVMELTFKIVDKMSKGEELTNEDLIEMKAAGLTMNFLAQLTGLPTYRMGKILQDELKKNQ